MEDFGHYLVGDARNTTEIQEAEVFTNLRDLRHIRGNWESAASWRQPSIDSRVVNQETPKYPWHHEVSQLEPGNDRFRVWD